MNFPGRNPENLDGNDFADDVIVVQLSLARNEENDVNCFCCSGQFECCGPRGV